MDLVQTFFSVLAYFKDLDLQAQTAPRLEGLQRQILPDGARLCQEFFSAAGCKNNRAGASARQRAGCAQSILPPLPGWLPARKLAALL
jgi:hypothetical protein